MAIVDIAGRAVTIKIVFYGCAQGGKTTNLELLQRLTDPSQHNGLVSIATGEDRTLFFDLLPLALGQIGGNMVKVKVYTVPGQVHYETTRRQILAGADGVVLVIDSHTEQQKSNAWAMENLRLNLRAHGFNPDEMPIVLQWNKRDLPEARALEDLEAELNKRQLPSHEAVAVTGAGVVDTFETVLQGAIASALKKAGKPVSDAAIATLVGAALADAKQAQPQGETRREFEHRFDMEGYRDQQAEQGRAKEIVDQESLLSESVKTNMMLAERLDGFEDVKHEGERRTSMIRALSQLSQRLPDVTQPALPADTLAVLAAGAERSQVSLLFFRPREEVMDERQVVPDGAADVLNSVVSEGLGSIAYRLAREGASRLIEDAQNDLFYGNPPPGGQDLTAVLTVPISCDGAAFGAIVVYSRINESPLGEAETEFWETAALLTGLSLHWRALRQKLQSRPA